MTRRDPGDAGPRRVAAPPELLRRARRTPRRRRPSRSAGSCRRSSRAPPSRSRSPARKPLSASHQIERPIAKPTKPSTGAACRSQWSTFSSDAPRPSSTQTTPSRPSPVRVCCGERLGVLARVDALDLPDVDLDAEVLDVLDRLLHQLRAAARRRSGRCRRRRTRAGRLGRHEQLEQELAVVGVQPVGELLEPAELALRSSPRRPRGCSGRAPWRSRRRTRSMCSPKSSPYWKSNSSWPDFSTGIASIEALLLGALGDVRAELLVDQHAGRGRRRRRARRPSPCPRRSAAWRRRSSRSPRASDRPRSRTSSSGTTRGGRRPGCTAFRRSRAPWRSPPRLCVPRVASMTRLPSPRREAQLHRAELHDRHRGGADDPRPRVAARS